MLLIAALLVGPALRAQDAGPAATDVKQTYDQLCAGCHGVDARGTSQGPGLMGPRVRRRSAQNLKNIVLKGIPAAGMPAFDLPAPTVEALAALVASLNAWAAEANVPGDRARGKEFFFGAGQ